METKDRAQVKRPANGQQATQSEAKAKPSNNGATPSKNGAEAKRMPPAKVVSIANATDRLNKFEQFQKLGERFEFLKNKDRELKNFQVSQDGTLAKITLACPGGNVEISNSTIIEKVVTLCQTELDDLLAKTEKEVIEFEI